MSRRGWSRRRFLLGAGGAALALPFLPSVFGRKAEAQFRPRPRFVGFTITHGGIRATNMYPAMSSLTERTTYYGSHDIHHGPLTLSVQGSTASLSPVLTASSAVLTPGLASKLSVLRGLDIVCVPGHHDGMFGAFAVNDNNNEAAYGGRRATLDQVMAQSPSFYAPTEPILAPSLNMGESHRTWSWGHNEPGNPSAGVYAVPSEVDPARLFDRVFRAPMEGPPPAEATPPNFIINRVIENYRRLRDSPRISAADRERLEQHISRFDALERQVEAVRNVSCGEATRPPSRGYPNAIGLDDAKAYYSLINDVTAVAFACGTTRVALNRVYALFTDVASDWHHDVAHNHTLEEPQAYLRDAARQFFEHVFLDLAAKLDVEEADGQTYLDNTLMMWTNEAGCATHHQYDVPLIVAGGAAGYLNTGRFIDFRNRSNAAMSGGGDAHLPDASADDVYPGLLYNQFLGTALQAMGVPPGEWEYPGERGFGYPGFGPDGPRGQGWTRSSNEEAYPDAVRSRASEPLPVFTA